LNGVCFTDSANGTVVGEDGTILRTSDGGNIWVKQSGSDTLGILRSVHFINQNTGWAVGGIGHGPGAQGTIFWTTDGGTNWEIQLFRNEFFSSVHFVNKDIGWITGAYGAIYKSTDGGIVWESQASGTGVALLSVYFVDSNTGWAVGTNGTILKTNDSGVNWVSQISGTTEPLYSVYFIDSNVGWIAGGQGLGGRILNTNNGGENWEYQYGYSKSLFSIYFINHHIGWVAGDNATILHTTNGGVSFVEEEEIDELPSEFLITQNYPNPFNPSTKIKYLVPQLSYVAIKVFDILGNEIETLVNEEKTTGIYEVEFNASSLPGYVSAKGGYASGVYFYRLQVYPANGGAEGYVGTKKMLLLK
jgi:photosystem II stability/assembly factor-like uncharacterized protein